MKTCKKSADKPVVNKYKLTSDKTIGLKIAIAADLHDMPGDVVVEVLKSLSPDMILLPGDITDTYDANFNQLMKDEYQVYLAKSGRTPTNQKFQKMYIAKSKHPKLYLLTRVLIHILGCTKDEINKITKKIKREGDGCEYGIKFLKDAADIAPCYLSLGNHDEELKSVPEGIKLLDNEYLRLYFNDREIVIGGVSRSVDLNWLEEFTAIPAYHILLCHYPELYETLFKNKKIELVVSGHAHGGQIRIGNKGLYAPGQGIFPKYTKGVYDNRLVVTAGLCNNGVIPRWGNPIEIVELEI